MRLLFVMDPAHGMSPTKDTSFAFLRGARALGNECWHCLPHDLWLEGPSVHALARPIQVSDAAPHVILGEAAPLRVAALDAVLIRKDPPFDAAYAYLTQMLDLVKESVLVINDPGALRDANEKLYALRFPAHIPRTLVSSDPARLLAFVDAIGGHAVLKPLDGAGGAGVVKLDTADVNARALVDLLTREGRQLALVQEFQPAVREGDKRVLLLDGRPLGAILRVPRADDIRANIHVGGSVHPTQLTEAEQRLVDEVGPRLAASGLYFVGLDLIGGKLIEVNVTSPTGIQELSQHVGRPVEQEVIRWIEQRVAARAR